jgi:hypothetical protein
MKCNEQFKLGRASMTTDDGRSDIRMIAIDLLDEIIAEARADELEHDSALADALALFGEGHDPKMLARALWVAIADHLSGGL